MSLIISKTHLTTPMLPLHAIPTEVIRKGFRPYRGFSTSLPINLPTEDLPLRFQIGRPQSALSDEKVAELALNVQPLFSLFARLFGYDPEMLKVGNGDCGVEGHDWNLYGEKDRVPQVVRWRAFGGEALFCVGPDAYNRLAQIVGLADEAMAPHMARVFAAIGELHAHKDPQVIDRPAGDLLERLLLDDEYDRGALSSVYWCETGDVEPTAQQAADLNELRFSCRLRLGTPRRVRMRHGRPQAGPSLGAGLPGTRYVRIGRENDFLITLQPDEPTPAYLLRQLHAEAVKDVEAIMQALLMTPFESQVERAHEFLALEDLSVAVGNLEENERAYALAYFIGQGEARKIHSINDLVRKTTFSREFRTTPAKTLLGTHALKKLYDGHVVPGADLVEMLITNVHHEVDRVLDDAPEYFELLGRVIVSDELAQRRDLEASYAKSYKLEKPYTALYRGMPIRVIDSYAVFHGDGSEGLACDYYVDHQNQALHFVSLYRVKAPKTE